MMGAALLAVLSLGSVGGAHLLSAARWTWRAPRIGIALWQALGLCWGLSTIGALLGAAMLPYGRGVAGGLAGLPGDGAARLGVVNLAALLAAVTLTAVLLVMLAYAVVRVVGARRRHRALLALVSRRDAAVPGTLVVDHPGAAAYCVPGVRSSKVVVSKGTLDLLDSGELAAVLAHERAHARERHDLVLLPFASLRHVFPQFGLVGRCLDAVELLIEMAADDRARHGRPPRELATALLRFAAARPGPAPRGALGVANTPDIPVMARVNRLLEPESLPRATRAAAAAAVPVVAGLPLLLLVMPH
ncbi:M56 family metallopeptidase [Spirillospora albida]|uniref:M56 family metallopeptidase n=1 Tax=Spirillospora albida TaxID=58123 RepID=UPI0009FF823F|nr:M56 family metallopeptidase [Spirillospora albida]